MDRYDATDQHIVFEGISDGIDNKFGLESIFYAMGFLTWIIVTSLFIDLFFTSITSPILYSTFAPVRRRRRSLLSTIDWTTILTQMTFYKTVEPVRQKRRPHKPVDSIDWKNVARLIKQFEKMMAELDKKNAAY